MRACRDSPLPPEKRICRLSALLLLTTVLKCDTLLQTKGLCLMCTSLSISASFSLSPFASAVAPRMLKRLIFSRRAFAPCGFVSKYRKPQGALRCAPSLPFFSSIHPMRHRFAVHRYSTPSTRVCYFTSQCFRSGSAAHCFSSSFLVAQEDSPLDERRQHLCTQRHVCPL